ncbi:hypothetical protein BDZ94DRAFT_1057108 [Collybia nuda]|uniref:MYND-type domain-containing protein n=1 Tax=Collybia nuda TaxID=64659 RepID=A0A9P5Y0W0_9AGAR|nr:hypothetical protein BDZ94DRAFT_1057108 [Collybia nuda]
MSTSLNIEDILDFSMWGDEFTFEAFKANPARWNKNWERASRIHTGSDVFHRMGSVCAPKRPVKESPITMLTEQLVKMQDLFVKVAEAVEGKEGQGVTAWLLLGQVERTKHLNKGFENSYPVVAARQDARCFAPEITVSALLKRNGQGFLELLKACAKGRRDAGEGKPYFHRSVWWDEALDEVPRSFLETLDEHAYETMTIFRNDFITKFLLYTALSVLHDLGHETPGVKRVTDFMTKSGTTAQSLAKAIASTRDKPVIRCQSCTSTQQESGPVYMLCSTCKSKLNFTIHYCSVRCQREDWRDHKRYCGKEKIAKNLPGTIHDRFWFQPDIPDSLRHLGTGSDTGAVDFASLGFGDPARVQKYSAALRRQVSLLNVDKQADYFLFDERDRPIRFEIQNSLLKTFFRITRTEALSSDNSKTLEGMVEYIIKAMGQKPGLSRKRIIAQFTKEYERDIVVNLAKIERVRGKSGLTVLENMSQGISTFMSPGLQ